MRRLLAAAYIANQALAVVLSVRHGLVARPLTLQTGWSVRKDLAIGFGSGLAAPWPLLAVLVWAHGARSQLGGEPREPTWVVWLWATVLIGALTEPITYEAVSGQTEPSVALVGRANVGIPLAMLASLARDRSDH